ncbi:hypothetical protein GALL_416240 [mine drainage metagenome]|uniref:Uncharacterized protein n=1 Tax=mine drainage metagenome TaxID=410659 RepID=A0A1J5Q096_9ZZZZ
MIAIDLANGNVIFEFAGYRFVQLMQQTQCGVAVNQMRDDKPKAVDVSDLRKAQILFIHFFVDGIERFFSTGNPDRQAVLCISGFQGQFNFFDQITSATTCLGNCF